MATEQQYIVGGNAARSGATQLCSLVISGTGTVKGQIAVPANSWLKSIALETPVAISGSPTSCNVIAGVSDAGAEVMAALDCKGQGHQTGTIVTGFDKVNGLVSNNTLYIQVTTSGGTAPSGTINVLVSYDPPMR